MQIKEMTKPSSEAVLMALEKNAMAPSFHQKLRAPIFQNALVVCIHFIIYI